MFKSTLHKGINKFIPSKLTGSKKQLLWVTDSIRRDIRKRDNWAASSEFDTYRLCEQRRFRRACASAQSRQNLRCSLKQAGSQEEPPDRKPDPWPLWKAGHAQLKSVMTECSKTQIRLTHHNSFFVSSRSQNLLKVGRNS